MCNFNLHQKDIPEGLPDSILHLHLILRMTRNWSVLADFKQKNKWCLIRTIHLLLVLSLFCLLIVFSFRKVILHTQLQQLLLYSLFSQLNYIQFKDLRALGFILYFLTYQLNQHKMHLVSTEDYEKLLQKMADLSTQSECQSKWK